MGCTLPSGQIGRSVSYSCHLNSWKEFYFCFFSSDPSLGDKLWSTAVYAGSYHLNVSYQVTLENPLVQNHFDLIFHKIKINTGLLFFFTV